MDDIDNEIEQSELEKRYFSEGMFLKNKRAAQEWLLAASNALLEPGDIHPVLRLTLGQALRDAALSKDNTTAIKALSKQFGLCKSIRDNEVKLNKFLQAKKAGATDTELATRYNTGNKNAEIAKILEPIEALELDELSRRLTHTVSRLLIILDEKERNEFTIPQLTERLREYLKHQFRLVSEKNIELHVQKALELAEAEHLTVYTGIVISRNPKVLTPKF